MVEETITAFSPDVILDDLLLTLRLYHSSLYEAVLEDPDFDVRDFALRNFTKPLHTMLHGGVPTDQEIVRELDQDMSSSNAAVNMHVFDHYQYVGQAHDLYCRVH